MLDRGVLTISIDYEFALGFADFDMDEEIKERMRSEIEITNRLLDLFERYNVPATWAVTGHLLEEKCSWKSGLPHPEYPRPIHVGEGRDWFLLHPKEGEYGDPLWFDVHRLVPKMLRSPVGHEIASHSYAHIIYGVRGVSEGAVHADIKNVKRIHNERRYPLYSFVFPRNSEAYHNELRAAGIRCYRGVRRTWYRTLPGFLGRGAHLVDYLLPGARTTTPKEGRGGLVNIEDSIMLIGRNGLRRIVTPAIMKWKLRRGIDAAVRRREIFHLWFHPSNFWYDTDTQVTILEDALAYASRLRANGVLEACTMRGVCERAYH